MHDKKTRSYNMSQIKGKNTKPEMLVRRFLHSQGFRFRIHDKRYPGKPDLVLPKYRTVIFVHGCFWHQHACSAGHIPVTRREFWRAKLTKNAYRDKDQIACLRKAGWTVLVLWECQLKHPVKVAKRLIKFLQKP